MIAVKVVWPHLCTDFISTNKRGKLDITMTMCPLRPVQRKTTCWMTEVPWERHNSELLWHQYSTQPIISLKYSKTCLKQKVNSTEICLVRFSQCWESQHFYKKDICDILYINTWCPLLSLVLHYLLPVFSQHLYEKEHFDTIYSNSNRDGICPWAHTLKSMMMTTLI
jgi:hypothetical protein